MYFRIWFPVVLIAILFAVLLGPQGRAAEGRKSAAVTPKAEDADCPGDTERVMHTWMLGRRGQYSEALSEDETIANDPSASKEESCTALEGIAFDSIMLGKRKSALKALDQFDADRKGLNIDPGVVAEAVRTRNELNSDSANKEVNFPGDTERVIHIWMLGRRGQYSKALSEYETIASDPSAIKEESSTALEGIAFDFMMLGRRKSALKALDQFDANRKGLNIDPGVVAEAGRTRRKLNSGLTVSSSRMVGH